MRMKHTKSGYSFETDVITSDGLHTSGVFILNPSGYATNRITTDPTIYKTHDAAEEASKLMGKQLLSNFLAGQEQLDFINNWES